MRRGFKVCIPKHLRKSYDMIIRAFPDGIDEETYFSIIYLLYDYFSDENLSLLLSYCISKERAVILNDIYGVFYFHLKRETLDRIREKLVKNGLQEIMDEE